MRRTLLGLMIGLLVSAGAALGAEAVGRIRRLDVRSGLLVIRARGGDRTFKLPEEVELRGLDGRRMPDGLRSEELVEGMKLLVTFDPAGSPPVASAIRLRGRFHEGRPSTGLKPLNEMTAADRYKGQDGGLYGGGRNVPPRKHQAAALAETARIVPLSAEGKPSKDGKIVLISISMSNATMEFSAFKKLADADPDKSSLLTIVDCAQGGRAMAQWAAPNARPWAEAIRRITRAKVTPRQVQIAWVKLANMGPRGELTEHGKKLQKDTLAVLQNAKARFPNLRIVYLASRIYAGYSTGRLNPEPYAYEGAFVVRWLIQDQIKGAHNLNYDPARGEVKAPLLLWGPYFWGDGMTPRKGDGLVWQRRDLAADGVHPTRTGQRKVAEMLLKFFKTDLNARRWFVKPQWSKSGT